jgi:putative ABC transport system permease protein
LDQLLNAFGLLQNSIGFAALLLGMAMIQSSFRLAVMQRFAEIGVLRALGATQKQIASVFLWEGAAVGLLGALLGLGLGILLSTLIAGYLNELLRGLLGSSSMGGSSLPGSGTILATIAVSVVTSIVAAFGPARSAAQLTPAAAMRAIPTQQPPSVSTLRAIAGVCALAISASVSPQSAATFYISLTLSFLGIVCLAPFMSLQLVRLARPLLARVWPLEGPLASDSLTQTSARTAPILTMLTMAFGQVIIVGGVAESAHATLADWVDRSFDQDLLISGSSNLVNRSLTFPADVQQQLASVAGVRSVEAVRQVDVRYESRTVLLLARDLTADCLRKGPVVVQGSWPGICRDVASGHGVVISENLGAVAKLARGDVFRFVTPSGPWELPVVGVVRDLQDPRGTVMIGWELYCRLWGDERIDKFRIFVAAGHSVDAVRASILERVGSKVPLTAFSREDVNEFIFRPAGRSLKGSYVQILIAGIIATLSLMNFLAISVVERRVFLAVFRTLGMTKAGVRKTLAIEALLAAGVGIVLGIACGALCLRLVLAATYSMVAGVRLEYSLPVGTMFALIPVAAIASILAAWLPVQHMFRSSLTESLARE